MNDMSSLCQANNPSIPLEFPATWASEWGEDAIGLWMAFNYQGVRQVFRWILPGEFMMGDDKGYTSEKPAHQVIITQGFWLAETTVTQALWQAVMGNNPSEFKGDNLPVENVSWNDASEFIKVFNALNRDLRLCLPSEAQWEYACRAGTKTRYSFGDEISHEQAHFSKNSWGDAESTIDVKGKPANQWGLYQMHGNVREWVQDRFDEKYYANSPNQDPSGPVDPQFNSRMLRGGCWSDYFAGSLRSACRNDGEPDGRFNYIGFRLARG